MEIAILEGAPNGAGVRLVGTPPVAVEERIAGTGIDVTKDASQVPFSKPSMQTVGYGIRDGLINHVIFDGQQRVHALQAAWLGEVHLRGRRRLVVAADQGIVEDIKVLVRRYAKRPIQGTEGFARRRRCARSQAKPRQVEIASRSHPANLWIDGHSLSAVSRSLAIDRTN